MFGLATKIFGSTSSRRIKELQSIVNKINNLEENFKNTVAQAKNK